MSENIENKIVNVSTQRQRKTKLDNEYKEKIKEYNENKKKIDKEKKKKYRERNKEKLKEKDKIYKEQNREKIKEEKQEYREKIKLK